MKKKWLAALLCYIILIIVCLTVVYAVPSVRSLFDKTYIAEYGSLDISDEVSAFIIRDELVYVAAQDCSVTRKAAQDRLVKAGSHVVKLEPVEEKTSPVGSLLGNSGSGSGELKPEHKYLRIIENLGNNVRETVKGYNKTSGYISYLIDGAESSLTTDGITTLKKGTLEELTGMKTVEGAEGKCAKGTPLFKVISNSKWFLIYYTDDKTGARYSEGMKVGITADEHSLPATVEMITSTRNNGTRIVLSCKSFFDGFLERRTLDTTVTLASVRGLLLKDASIFKDENGQTGVFIKNKLGQHRFRPVSVKADDGDKCVVYSDFYVDAEGSYVNTIATYDEIVEEPSAEDLSSIGIEPEGREEKK